MVEKYIHSSYIMGAGKMPTPQEFFEYLDLHIKY